jgi:RNA polymerase sigma factor (sigma-70 family)
MHASVSLATTPPIAVPSAAAAGEARAGAEHAIPREHETAILRDALLRLPAQQRTVLALYYVEALTPREIAAVLGRSESRVLQIREKALRTLRGTLRAPTRRAA